MNRPRRLRRRRRAPVRLMEIVGSSVRCPVAGRGWPGNRSGRRRARIARLQSGRGCPRGHRIGTGQVFPELDRHQHVRSGGDRRAAQANLALTIARGQTVRPTALQPLDHEVAIAVGRRLDRLLVRRSIGRNDLDISAGSALVESIDDLTGENRLASGRVFSVAQRRFRRFRRRYSVGRRWQYVRRRRFRPRCTFFLEAFAASDDQDQSGDQDYRCPAHG